MKKNLYSIICAITCYFISVIGVAQSAIPNGNFENWTSGTFDIPQNYVQCSNTQMFYAGLPFNEVKSNDAKHGSYAVQLTTEILSGDTLFGYFINTNPNNGNGPSSWHGGFAYNQTPTGIRGYYKSSIASPDTARIAAFFYKNDTLIGGGAFPLFGTNSSYTLFSFTFNPPLPVTPDTVVFAVASSDFMNNSVARNGSMLKLDSVSFTGVTGQPALFNGDFENWQSQTLTKLNNWYLQGSWDGGGVLQTNDKVAGSYAVEMLTRQGDRNGIPAAQGSGISTGYYLPCAPPPAPCVQGGGYPFTNQIDTLVFSYKYVPMGNDSASVNLTFKNNGNFTYGTGRTLGASPSYQVMEIPFNTMNQIDSVVVEFQSSVWQDSALSYVGSSLKVDEVHFKSQPLNTGVFNFSADNSILIYPNPSDGKFTFQMQSAIERTRLGEDAGYKMQDAVIEIYNVLGEKIYKSTNPLMTNAPMTIDLSSHPKGIYFYQLKNDSGILSAGKLVIE